MSLNTSQLIKAFVLATILQLSLTSLNANEVPNGELLVFSSLPANASGNARITFLSEGSGEVFYLNPDPRKAYPNVSPDGQLMAYLEGSDLKVSSLNGLNPRTIKTGLDNNSSPAVWSPQGTSLAYFTFVRHTNETASMILTVIDLEGNTLHSHSFSAIPTFPAFAQLAAPSWSPDGTRIAGVVNQGTFLSFTIGVIELTTGELTRLFEMDQFAEINRYRRLHFTSPVWSPSGDEIAFVLSDANGVIESNILTAFIERNVFVVPASGGTPQNRTNFPARRDEVEPLINIQGLAWSPDGSELAFHLYDFSNVATPDGAGLYRKPAVGGSPSLLLNINAFSFGHNLTHKTLQWVDVRNTPPKIVLNPDKSTYEVEEEFVVTIEVNHELDVASTYSFVAEPLQETGSKPHLEKVVPVIPDFELTLSDRVRTFSVPVVAISGGASMLRSELKRTTPDGIETLVSEREIIIRPIQVEVIIKSDQHHLNQTNESKWGAKARAFNQARRTDGDDNTEPYPNLVQIDLQITNISDETVKNLTVPDAEELLGYISSTDAMRPGVPLTPIYLYGPNGEEIDLTNSEADPTIESFDLAEDQVATYTWLADAFDDNPDPDIDNSADLETSFLVLGSIEAVNIRALGEEEFAVIDQPLLRWGIQPRDGRTQYPSGNAVRVDGFLENVSADDGGEGKELLAMVYAIQEGNLLGGFAKKQSLSGFPSYYEIFELPSEGDEKRIAWDSIFMTLPTELRSSGTARYGVRVWIVNEDDSLTSADGQVLLGEDWLREFEVNLSANFPIPTAEDVLRQECIDSGLSPIVCGLLAGTAGLPEDAVAFYGMASFLIKTRAKQYTGMIAYEQLVIKSLFDAATGDPDALNELYRESYEKYTQLVELGVMAGEGLSNTPMLLDTFIRQAGDATGKFLDAAFQEDFEEVQFQLGKFVGANPDLAVEPLMVGMTYARLAKAARVAEATIGNDVIATQRQLDIARQSETLPSRLAAGKADPTVTDLSSVLLPGDKLSLPNLLEVFGVDADQLRKLQKIARDNGVMISFRSRSSTARELLSRNLAWPKPQRLKFKTVNEIDYKYLNYDPLSDSTLDIIEPPSDVINKTGTELETALDLYMGKMRDKFPDLASNDVLEGEVRSRLKLRTEEWNDLVPELRLQSGGVSDISLPTNFEANLQFGLQKERDLIPDIAPAQERTVRTTPVDTIPDPVGGNPRKRWTLDMSDANGTNFKPVTGDIDIMAILEPNGSMIQDADRRLRVYKQLAEAVDMQHGESFTFFIENARRKYLDGNTFGEAAAEALCTISPFGDQTPTAAFFMKSLSIMDGLNDRFRQTRGAIKQADKLKLKDGKLVLEKGKTITTRRKNVTGDYVVMAGPDINSHINLNLVAQFKPLILKETFAGFKKRILFILSRNLPKFLNLGDQEETFERPQPNTRTLSGSPPLLQALQNPETGLIEPIVWQEGLGWSFITSEEALALGRPDVLDMLPMTQFSEKVPRATVALPIIPFAELETTGEFFEIGDRIIIAPGTEKEEFGTLKSVQPFTLAEKTVYEHEAGVMIATLGPDTTDRDGDSLEGFEEISLGTNPDLFDSDSDGIGDGAEITNGTDPINSGLTFANFNLDTEIGFNFSWKASPGSQYVLQGSTTLQPDDWRLIQTVTATSNLVELSAINAFPESPVAFFRIVGSARDDSDGDGLSARDELGLGTDPSRQDSDGDGYHDGLEINMGTDPLDSSSKLEITTIEVDNESAESTFTFSSVIGTTYVIESSSTMREPWTAEMTFTAKSTFTNAVLPLSDNASASLFIRIRALGRF